MSHVGADFGPRLRFELVLNRGNNGHIQTVSFAVKEQNGALGSLREKYSARVVSANNLFLIHPFAAADSRTPALRMRVVWHRTDCGVDSTKNGQMNQSNIGIERPSPSPSPEQMPPMPLPPSPAPLPSYVPRPSPPSAPMPTPLPILSSLPEKAVME